MADLTSRYSPDDAPNSAFDPLPAGKYTCVISDSEMRPTKRGDGEYLLLELEVIDGPHAGRRLWDRLTLRHPNETAVRIARGALAQIRQATGVLQPRDSVELHNIPIVVSVGCKRRDDPEGAGEITNVVKAYARRTPGSASGAPGPGGGGAVAGSVPPWKR